VTGPLPVAVSVKPRRRRPDSDVMPAQAMPLEGPLIDRYGRVHDDLRISVTDRCNLRCVYCMPEEGLSFLPRNELLTFDEITRLAQVAKSLGVSALRLTGGEPLVRKGLPSLIGRLAAVGFEDLAMTTNGTELAGVARELAAAGLRRVNVSCDSLRPERFAAIRRRGKLDVVLNAMTAAEEAGLTPLKVNVVLLRGHNDDEILDFASLPGAPAALCVSSSSCRWTPRECGIGTGSFPADKCSSASRLSGLSSRSRIPRALHQRNDSALPTESVRSA